MPRAAVTHGLYERLPIPLQNAACSYYGWREGRTRLSKAFERRLAALLESEWWSAERIAAYQDAQLRELVAHAYANVPFYGERMRAAGVRPSEVGDRADLAKLPLLTKEDVRANDDSLLARPARRRRLVAGRTSGTTGTSLHFRSSPEAIAFQWAVWWRHRLRFGLGRDDWHVNFTGKLAVPPRQERPPYWRWNLPARQALVNMQQLTPTKIAAVVDFLSSRRFEYYSGYPSIIHALALTAREAGLALAAPPRVVTTGAEQLLGAQRRDIERFTDATLTEQYGLSEGCGNASHCEQLVFHEDFEFGILECVDPEPLEDGAVRGRIVCTGFACPEFPFIRYDTGDVGVWRPSGERCPCGRESQTLRAIEGRVEDYVSTPEGRLVMRFDYVFKDARNVREAQVVQERPEAIRVRVVRRPAYTSADEAFIADEIRAWISARLEVEFEYVQEIEREPNGKFRAVKSFLAREREAATLR